MEDTDWSEITEITYLHLLHQFHDNSPALFPSITSVSSATDFLIPDLKLKIATCCWLDKQNNQESVSTRSLFII